MSSQEVLFRNATKYKQNLKNLSGYTPIVKATFVVYFSIHFGEKSVRLCMTYPCPIFCTTPRSHRDTATRV